MPEDLLRKILHDSELSEALASSFDFDVNLSKPIGEFERIEPECERELIAGDGSGGIFFLCGHEKRVLYVSSEGQASIVAPNFTAFLIILLTYPDWQSLLKFSAGGQLEEMRLAADALDRDSKHSREDLHDHRQLICSRLGLQCDPEIIGELHRSVSGSREKFRIYGPDGTECDSLFGTFPASRLSPPQGYRRKTIWGDLFTSLKRLFVRRPDSDESA